MINVNAIVSCMMVDVNTFFQNAEDCFDEMNVIMEDIELNGLAEKHLVSIENIIMNVQRSVNEISKRKLELKEENAKTINRKAQ